MKGKGTKLKKIIVRLLALSVCLMLLFVILLLFKPEWLIDTFTRADTHVLFAVEINEPVVALTIDDGPDAGTTGRLLEILAQNNARATFFTLSSHVLGNESFVEEILDEGHEIGNHTVYDEPNITLERDEFEEKFLKADKILGQYGPVSWFRPGYGFYNQEMVDFVESHGYRTVLGSVHPFDPQIPSVAFASWYILQHTRPGSIIMLHDCGGRGERTAEVLEVVLPELTRRGYRVVTLTELVELDQG